MSCAREQAAFWFTRLLDVPDDHQDRARFDHWLRADPEHRAEYQAFCELWGDLASTRKTETLAQQMEHHRGRRRFLRSGVLGLAGMVIAGFSWRHGSADVYECQLSTAKGERQHHHLPDGSGLSLGADTRIHVRYDGLQRQLFLLQGEAIFDVARDVERPFVVDGGLARVTVLGTRFVVNRLHDRLRVSVERGRVQVDAEPSRLQLNAGDVAQIVRGDSLRRLTLPADNAFAFARGRLIFTKADLSEIADSLSRYRDGPVINVPGKPSPSITAVVQLTDIDSFLAALPAIAPVEITQLAGTTQMRAR
ncbi:FecR domain-containing protein [Xanthomonas sp. WHRI 1810A]|uniref:FecR family protein n=1 Tax=Xanthomonas sp. WHRI 1810A TaxID=3161565 RepID=UPI0032E8EE93